MGTQGQRTRSHAHGKRHGRMMVHLVVMLLAAFAVVFAARFPNTSSASSSLTVPAFSLSGLTGSTQSHTLAYFRPASTNQTQSSVADLVSTTDVSSIRAAGGVSPTASFSAGVTAAAVSSGEQGANVKPLADIIDPRQPFVLYEAQPGDSASVIAGKFGIKLQTLLMNNPEVRDSDLIQRGQQLVVPRKDGILYKIKSGDTVGSVVGQYDNITSDAVVSYKPNAIADGSTLKQGDFLLLIGATIKPPPPPPPPPPARPSSSGGPVSGRGGSAAPGANGIFHFPLATWRGVSDPFGVDIPMNRFHTGIDLDLYGLHHSTIFSACDGTVTTTEFLTYSYGYHVIVDCGGGWSTLYAHMDAISVSPGQHVSAGAPLGVSGTTGFTTGEHLHFEILKNGSAVNPADYLDFGPVE
jgi:murein DD-endopeptidase MepM/ murein hydrolase activator NlpD